MLPVETGNRGGLSCRDEIIYASFLLCVRLQESPSNKLLYAKEISTYKKMVDE